MPHNISLITTIAAALGFGLVLGYIATRLRLPALVGYLEWGSRLAVLNSADGAKVSEHAPMPKWGWGETGGPYIPK